MVIQEQTLQHLTQCPLIDPAPPSKEELCANALTTWVLRQAFEDKLKGDPQKILHDIRGELLNLYYKLFETSQAEFDWEIPIGTLARTAAFRIFNLILDFEVIHLEQPYNLILSGYTIQGKYALLRKRKGECLPYVLVLHTTEPALRKEQVLPPDVITLARYIHVYVNSGYKSAQVLHYPVFRGNMWYNKTMNISLAIEYLISMLKTAQIKPEFPSAGSHCAKCIDKPCLEVFKWIE